MTYEKELMLARRVGIEAGKLIMEVYVKDEIGLEIKSDDSPVTFADKISNDYIVEAIRKEFPSHGILSEEGGDDKSRFERDYVWIIDPLDGTKEFVKKNGEFSVNIALCYKGRPVVGVIYIPIRSELFYAVKGEGAFMEDMFGHSKPIAVSNKRKNITILRSRSKVSERLHKLFEHEKVWQVRKVGSALKGCEIARGAAEAYYSLGFTMEWDTAAMELIVNEAGGIFRQLDDSQMTYNRVDSLNRKGFYIINRDENKLL